MLNVNVRGRLKRQGLAELFFESAEPTFDELDPEKFFKRFSEGWYEIEGITLDGEERENEVYLSHVMPAAPAGVTTEGLNGVMDTAEDCDVDSLPYVDPTGGVTIDRDPVTVAHAMLGTHTGETLSGIGDGISVLYYEVVVEIDESNFKASAFVPADVTEWTFSEDFFDLSDEGEYKYEILVRTNIIDDDGEVVTVEVEVDEGPPAVVVEVDVPGNKSAMESCFTVELEE